MMMRYLRLWLVLAWMACLHSKLIAAKTSTLFEIFADDDRFASVLRTYSYQQVIPILYYFYQKPQRTFDVATAISRFEVYRLFEEPEEHEVNVLSEHVRIEHANWALQRIYESGQTFLRQFAVSEQGEVQPLPLVALTNLVESVFLRGLEQSQISSSGSDSPTASQDRRTCEFLKAALQALGLLPAEFSIAPQTTCLALQAGLPHVTTIEGIDGLIRLDEYTDLLNRYGNGIVPFVARYGRKGIDLLEQTHGEILYFSTLYGEEMMQYIQRYGLDVFTLIKTYGDQILTRSGPLTAQLSLICKIMATKCSASSHSPMEKLSSLSARCSVKTSWYMPPGTLLIFRAIC